MLQAQYRDLLQHPDISFDQPATGEYIEVNDAATQATLAWQISLRCVAMILFM